MNRRTITLFFSLVVATSSAHAQESVPLCAPPLNSDCVAPNWGQILPDGTDDSASNAMQPLIARSLSTEARMTVQLLSVAAAASTNASKAGVPIKAVVGGAELFKRETDALTAAIKKARFDRAGRFVAGEARVAQAAARARKAAAGYALTLYVKAPSKFNSDQRSMLTGRIVSINRVLAATGSKSEPGKPQS